MSFFGRLFDFNRDGETDFSEELLGLGMCYPTLLGYLEYIVEHDYFRMLNPIHPAPKKKEPPRKGTKRYRKQQKRAKKQALRESIRNVLNLIDTIRV